jgi:hypothetical protein
VTIVGQRAGRAAVARGWLLIEGRVGQPRLRARHGLRAMTFVPHNTRLLPAGAYALKEMAFVRLPAQVLRRSGRLAGGRVARSRSAIR